MLTTGTAACTSSFSLELQRKRATSLLSTVKMQMNNPLQSGSKNSTMPSRRFKSNTLILLGNNTQEAATNHRRSNCHLEECQLSFQIELLGRKVHGPLSLQREEWRLPCPPVTQRAWPLCQQSMQVEETDHQWEVSWNFNGKKD
mgnify:CR=1 FL=1